MLIEFSVENFRSIREKQTFSFLSTNYKEKLINNVFTLDDVNLLKSAIIYGANASGKSNFLRALSAFKNIVVNSSRLSFKDPVPNYMPFKLDSMYLNKPTKFDIRYMSPDKVLYNYGFEFDSNQIYKEYLYFSPKGQKVKVFSTLKSKLDKNGQLKGPRKNIEKLMNSNNLFLSKAADNGNEFLQKVSNDIQNLLTFSISDQYQRFLPSDYRIKALFQIKSYKEKMNQFLRVADVGIEEVQLKKGDIDISEIKFPENMPTDIQEKIIDDLSMKIVSLHKTVDNERVEFDFIDDESDGTKKLFGLSGPIIKTLDKGGVLIIDELNNGLHPIISEYIIKLFNSKVTNPHNAQVILTTHDTNLLNPDLFRRDQIWFTDKNENKSTQLYCLSEFDYKDVRANIPFDKWYLSGKFGAIPIIKESGIDGLCIENNED